MEVGRHPDLVLEVPQEPDREHLDLHVDLVRELLADAAGILAGGAASELAALEEQHIDLARGEVVGEGAAHDPDAHYGYIGGFHARPQNSKISLSAAKLVMSF